MKVPFLDLKLQYKNLRFEINSAVQNVMVNSAFILGEAVENFQKDFASVHDVKYCIGTSSGTSGNHLVLWSLGLGPGDEVIIPANTFIATVWGATLCGAKPVFVDCEEDSYNIDPVKVEEAITSKTKAIVAVHLYGQPANMNELLRIAEKYGLFLVEDAAQAHLAEYCEQKVGGIGIASSFSFYPGKNLGAYGEAGAVCTNDEVLAEKIRMMREHGQSQKYYHDIYGHNYRMAGIQGAVLGIKLKYLSDWTESRRKVAQRYNSLLKDIDEIKLPVEMDYAKHVYHLFVVKLASKSINRSSFTKYLMDKGISTGLHYPVPLHLQNCFSNLNYKKGDFPVTESLADNCVSLPMFPEITDQQIEYVCLAIKEYFAEMLVDKNHKVTSELN